MPRKTLFKPDKKPNMKDDPLWNEVFLNEREDVGTKRDNVSETSTNYSSFLYPVS